MKAMNYSDTCNVKNFTFLLSEVTNRYNRLLDMLTSDKIIICKILCRSPLESGLVVKQDYVGAFTLYYIKHFRICTYNPHLLRLFSV